MVRSHRAPLRTVASLIPDAYAPTPERPVRCKARHLQAHTFVLPHRHAWAQVATSSAGAIRLTTPRATLIVPPGHAVWVPPHMEHAVTMVESSDLQVLYVHQPPGVYGPGVAQAQQGSWAQCRVLAASPLLRTLIDALLQCAGAAHAPQTDPARLRERHLAALIVDELRCASAVRLGVDMPRDKRLRALCEAVLADPARHATLHDWAQGTGASARTVARLFRQELASTFTQWRQQVLLARAVSLAAGRMPVGQIALELGYSPSAFSAMVRRAVGQTPGQFLGGCA